MSATDAVEYDDTPEGDADKWRDEISTYEKNFKPWEDRAKKIVKRYKDERDANDERAGFNALWSNIQTLKPALFAKNPVPNVERRFQDDDDLGRVSSEVLERSTSFFIQDHFFDAIKQTVLDRLLPGRGAVWVRYAPTFEVTDDEEDADDEQLKSEDVIPDYVHWQDFGHTYGRVWSEVTGVWRKVYMTRNALIKRFGKELAKTIPLDYGPENVDDRQAENVKKATIYEIWCKTDKTVYWLHISVEKMLDSKKDPLKLSNFFPCPMPLFSTLANDSLVPVPDYAEYQSQAMELDRLTRRINAITKALKVAGVYASDAAGIQRLLIEGTENELVPIDQWQLFAEKGGLKGVMEFLPLAEIAKALEYLYKCREQVKNDMYEISGMSDIIRGQGDSDETATGVKTKGQFAMLRLNAMQQQVARFCRDTVRIMAEIIAEHFSLETIQAISGIKLLTQQQKAMVQQVMQIQQAMQQQPQQTGQPPPQMPPLPPEIQTLFDDKEKLAEMMDDPTWEEVYGLLKNDDRRAFRIDIETDSTIKMDQQQERQDRIEFLQAAGGFIQQAVTVQNPALEPLLMEMLMFGVRGFSHTSRDLESAFKVAKKKIDDAAENPPQQPPDPKLQLEQIKQQGQQAQQQAQIQHEQMIAQRDAQQEQLKASVGQQMQAQEFAHQRQLADMKAEHEQTMSGVKAQLAILQMAHEKNQAAQEHATAGADKGADHLHEAQMAVHGHAHEETMADKQAEHAKEIAKAKPKNGRPA